MYNTTVSFTSTSCSSEDSKEPRTSELLSGEEDVNLTCLLLLLILLLLLDLWEILPVAVVALSADLKDIVR